MIRTDIDIKDLLYQWVNGSNLASEISGKVYKDKRPLNSEKEDAIIAVIGRDARQIQEAIVNVNVYVADKRRGKEAIEDTIRLRTLCTICANLFEYSHFGDWICELDSQEVMEAGGIDWHIINNRLRLRFSNEQ
jgi:hypothetical protein